MRKIIAFFKNDRTVKSTTLMVAGGGVANVGAYLYHLFMGRLLLTSDYGALQSLISLSNILNVPLVTLNTVVVKFVSTYIGKGELHKISSLYYRMQKVLFILLIIGGCLFLVFTKAIMNFLHLDTWVNVLILDLALFFGLVNTLNRATLQGMSLFIPLTISQFIEAYGKLLVGVIAVLIGWRVPGAFGAFVFVIFLSFAYMFRILQNKLGSFSPQPLPIRAMSTYAIPSALMTISVVALYNSDVVLVRHFLSAHEAGLYAALSVLGKIIFFGASPIAVTMFPLVSEAHAKGESYRKILHTSIVFTLGIAGIVMLFYGFFPEMMLRILIGSQYLAASVYLVRFGMFLSLCTVINLLANYYLSIHETMPIYIVGFGAIIQAVLLFFFHANLSTVITVSLSVTSAVTALLGIYYVFKRK